MTEKLYADWSISLDVECPHCKTDIDLIEHAGECLESVDPLAQDAEIEVTCPKCDKEFTCETHY